MAKLLHLAASVKKPEDLKVEEEKILTDAYNIIKRVRRLSSMPAEKRKLWAEAYANGVITERKNVEIKGRKVDVLVETFKDPKREKVQQTGEEAIAEIVSFLEA